MEPAARFCISGFGPTAAVAKELKRARLLVERRGRPAAEALADPAVKLKSLGKAAIVQRQVDDNIFEVSVGLMKMRVNRDDIALPGTAP